MKMVFDYSFKKMTVELSYLKGSVLESARELEMDTSRLSKWRMDSQYNRDSVLPKNNKLTPDE